METSIISDKPFESVPFKAGSGGAGSDLFSEIQDSLSDRVAELELQKEELAKKVCSTQKAFYQIVAPLLQKFDVDAKGNNYLFLYSGFN